MAHLNSEYAVECVQLSSGQSPSSIIWTPEIPKRPYEHMTYFSNDTVAMNYVWRKSNVICFPGDMTQAVDAPQCATWQRSGLGLAVYVMVAALFLGLLYFLLRLGWRLSSRFFGWVAGWFGGAGGGGNNFVGEGRIVESEGADAAHAGGDEAPPEAQRPSDPLDERLNAPAEGEDASGQRIDNLAGRLENDGLNIEQKVGDLQEQNRNLIEANATSQDQI